MSVEYLDSTPRVVGFQDRRLLLVPIAGLAASPSCCHLSGWAVAAVRVGWRCVVRQSYMVFGGNIIRKNWMRRILVLVQAGLRADARVRVEGRRQWDPVGNPPHLLPLRLYCCFLCFCPFVRRRLIIICPISQNRSAVAHAVQPGVQRAAVLCGAAGGSVWGDGGVVAVVGVRFLVCIPFPG